MLTDTLDLGLPIILLMVLAAFAAGWIDAVVGGGGLLQLPALLLVPGISPVQALATNKLASIFGTTTSAITFFRRARPDLRTALPMAAVALAIGGGGAMSSLETTVLMTVEETMDALGRAQQIKYRPPGAERTT